MSTSTLLDEPTTKKKPEPVILRSAHDYAITQTALEAHKESLDKLATKNSDAGYSREARAIAADALAIQHHILPQLRSQREMPLVTHEQLEQEIAGALRRAATVAFEGLGNPKVVQTPEAIAGRRERMIEVLAKRVSLYVKDVADDAFNQGVAARSQSSEALALHSIATLRASVD